MIERSDGTRPLYYCRIFSAAGNNLTTMVAVLNLDNYDLPGFMPVVATFGSERFGYVVTPNVDHVIRFHDDEIFRDTYGSASYVLLDSRVLALLLKMSTGLIAPVCPGSDLTTQLFRTVIAPTDRVVIIGSTDLQARTLAREFGLLDLRHFNPPMDFIRDAAATETCLAFIEACSPFRFCLLAVGSPQQEIIAQQLKRRGRARGLALCIGASINFLTGDEQRAPAWMQRAALEWMYRLLSDPARLARRYLIRGPRVFGVLRNLRIGMRSPDA